MVYFVYRTLTESCSITWCQVHRSGSLAMSIGVRVFVSQLIVFTWDSDFQCHFYVSCSKQQTAVLSVDSSTELHMEIGGYFRGI